MIQSTLDQYHHQVQSILVLKRKFFLNIFLFFLFFLPSDVKLAKSRIIVENNPSFHSRVAGLIIPKSSSLVTAFGLRSTATGLRF
jgi:hypothetical protein